VREVPHEDEEITPTKFQTSALRQRHFIGSRRASSRLKEEEQLSEKAEWLLGGDDGKSIQPIGK
jgi:hypothetical protein